READWLLLGPPDEEGHDRLQRKLLLPLGRELEEAPARLACTRQKRGEEWQRVAEIEPVASEHGIDRPRESGEHVHDWAEGAVLAFGHTPTLEPRARRDPASQLAHQPRFPDSRLAGDQDGSGLASAGLAPALEELIQLAAAADERCFADPGDGVPPAPAALARQSEHREGWRTLPPLDLSRRLGNKFAAQETVCVGT